MLKNFYLIMMRQENFLRWVCENNFWEKNENTESFYILRVFLWISFLKILLRKFSKSFPKFSREFTPSTKLSLKHNDQQKIMWKIIEKLKKYSWWWRWWRKTEKLPTVWICDVIFYWCVCNTKYRVCLIYQQMLPHASNWLQIKVNENLS